MTIGTCFVVFFRFLPICSLFRNWEDLLRIKRFCEVWFWGTAAYKTTCISLPWYFQNLPKCPVLLYLNYVVRWSSYGWPLALVRFNTQVLFIFTLYSWSLRSVRSSNYTVQIMSSFMILCFITYDYRQP